MNKIKHIMGKNDKIKSFFSITIIAFLVMVFLLNQICFTADSAGNIDTDDDGIDDSTEKMIGSNLSDSSDVKKIEIKKESYYLVDSTGDKLFDKLYNKNDGFSVPVSFNDEAYLIDLNQDGEYDYSYSNGVTSTYQKEVEQFKIPWILVIITIIFVIILIIAILFKLGILYLYEEYVEE